MALNKIIVVKETDNKISVGLPVTQETLDSVTDRGNVTNNSITVSGLTVNGNINVSGISASGITANSINVLNTLTSMVVTTPVLNTADIFSTMLEVEDISVLGTSVFAGPVGIGTNAPTAALHVTGSALVQGGIDTNGNLTIEKGNPRLRFRDLSGGGHSQGFDIHVDTARFYIDDNTHNLKLLDFDFDSASSGHTLTMGSNKLVVATAPNGNYSPSSRVVVDGSGNVGVGTVSPDRKLDVSGEAIIRGSFEVTRPDDHIRIIYRSYNSKNSEQLFLLHNVQAWLIGQDGSDNKFKIASADSAFASSDVRLSIDTSGNVGIGTTSPSAKLHVSGDVRLDGQNTAAPSNTSTPVAWFSINVNGTNYKMPLYQ